MPWRRGRALNYTAHQRKLGVALVSPQVSAGTICIIAKSFTFHVMALIIFLHIIADVEAFVLISDSKHLVTEPISASVHVGSPGDGIAHLASAQEISNEPGKAMQVKVDGSNSDAGHLSYFDYLFVSIISPHAGGMPGRSESFRLGRGGVLQVSNESSDRILQSLHTGSVDDHKVFTQLSAVLSDQDAVLDKPTTNEVPDFYPSTVALIYAGRPNVYGAFSYPRERVPASVDKLVRLLLSVRDSMVSTPASSGTYIRAQRLPDFDPNIQKLDAVLTIEEVEAEEWLLQAIDREMALVRVADRGQGIAIGEVITLSPQGAIHVMVDNMVYRFVAFSMLI